MMRFLVLAALLVGLARSASFLAEDDDQFDFDFDLEHRVFVGKKSPCCFPDKFEAFFGERIVHGERREKEDDFSSNDVDKKRPHPRPPQHMAVVGRMSVDSKAKKAAVFLHVMQRPTSTNMIVIVDSAEKTMYIAYPDKKACQKLPAPKHSESMCILPNSTYAGSFRLGVGDNSIEVDAWKSRVAKHKPMPVVMGVEVLVASGSCVPISERGGGRVGKMSVGFEASFVNLNLTISDPKVFTPPSYCDDAEVIDPSLADPTVLAFASRFGKH